jgi:hypothetical protein
LPASGADPWEYDVLGAACAARRCADELLALRAEMKGSVRSGQRAGVKVGTDTTDLTSFTPNAATTVLAAEPH